MSIKTTIANLGRFAAMLAFGGAFVVLGTQTGSLEGRTNPEVKPTAGTAVHLEMGQGVQEATMDPQYIHVWLEWDPFGAPLVYQSPYITRPYGPSSYTHLPIPGDWPLPPGDLVMCYGRFNVMTNPKLPDFFYLDVKCLTLDRYGYDYYITSFPDSSGFRTFCTMADYPYRFPIFPSTLLEFEVTLYDLEGEYKTIVRTIVL
jgi:hypothetical protein